MTALPRDVYTLDDLRRWPEVVAGLAHPVRLAVFGDPVAHSRSPQLHEPALRACGIDSHYVRVHVRSGELAEALAACRAAGFIGVNLTIPHKQEVFPLLDEVDEHAKTLGAVNTVWFDTDRAVGFNTDGPGFVRAVRHAFGLDVRDLRVLVLGAGGGAGRGITVQCALENCQRFVLANRTREKAEALLPALGRLLDDNRVPGPMERLEVVDFTPEAIRPQIPRIDLVVNATSIGMQRTDPPALPREILAPHLVVYDTVYVGGRHTKLMAAAEEAGGSAANGLEMLLCQGALAFEIWFDREAPVEVMRRGLLGEG